MLWGHTKANRFNVKLAEFGDTPDWVQVNGKKFLPPPKVRIVILPKSYGVDRGDVGIRWPR